MLYRMSSKLIHDVPWDTKGETRELLVMPTKLNENEPPHDKTNEMACAPSKDSDQPGHLASMISLRCALSG